MPQFSFIFISLIFSAFLSAIPLPKHAFGVKGKFTAQCFLMNAFMPEGGGTALIYLVDARGKIRWHYVPTGEHSSDARTRVILAKPMSGHRIGLLRPYDRSRFEILGGGKLGPMVITPSGAIHHDFLESSPTEILTLGNSRLLTRKPGLFYRRPMSYMGSPIVQMSLGNGLLKEVWDYLSARRMVQDRDWKAAGEDSGEFWVGSKSPTAQYNFTHGNSIQWAGKERVLVSLRSLNKLVLVDLKTHETVWTVGASRQNDFSTAGLPSEFYRQHHASYLPDGNILVFDNGRTRSRVLRLHLNPKTHQAELLTAYSPKPELYSQRHGSAYYLDNGNVLAFFPHTSDQTDDINHVIEFDGKSGNEIARMSIDFGSNSSGYRAVPYPGACQFP